MHPHIEHEQPAKNGASALIRLKTIFLLDPHHSATLTMKARADMSWVLCCSRPCAHHSANTSCKRASRSPLRSRRRSRSCGLSGRKFDVEAAYKKRRRTSQILFLRSLFMTQPRHDPHVRQCLLEHARRMEGGLLSRGGVRLLWHAAVL